MKKSYVFWGVIALFIVIFILLKKDEGIPSGSLGGLSELIEKGEVDLRPTPTAIPPQIASGILFKNEEEIEIIGYSGHAMEPGISKDGNYLLFNDGPDGKGGKDIHWAVRTNSGDFRYGGAVDSLNISPVDGTPAFDLEGRLYFTSVFERTQTFVDMFTATFDAGKAENVKPIQGDIYIREDKWFSIDPDPSPDGEWLYYSEAFFEEPGALPTIFDVRAAKRVGGEYVLDKSITKNINTNDLEYAPTISADGLEIFFTRVNFGENRKIVGNGIFAAHRRNTNEPFGAPERIDPIKAPFVEAPTISLDGKELYYHKEVDGKFKIFRVTR